MAKTHTANIHEAKTNLSQLITGMNAGIEIMIARAGEPVARLVPFKGDRPVRRPGYLKGKVRIGKDFDAPLSDAVLKGFEPGRP